MFKKYICLFCWRMLVCWKKSKLVQSSDNTRPASKGYIRKYWKPDLNDVSWVQNAVWNCKMWNWAWCPGFTFKAFPRKQIWCKFSLNSAPNGAYICHICPDSHMSYQPLFTHNIFCPGTWSLTISGSAIILFLSLLTKPTFRKFQQWKKLSCLVFWKSTQRKSKGEIRQKAVVELVPV